MKPSRRIQTLSTYEIQDAAGVWHRLMFRRDGRGEFVAIASGWHTEIVSTEIGREYLQQARNDGRRVRELLSLAAR